MVLRLGVVRFCHYSPLGRSVPKSPDPLLVLPCVPPRLSCPAFVEEVPASVVPIELEALRASGGALPSLERLISTVSSVPVPPKPKSSKLRSDASPPAEEPDPPPDLLVSAVDAPPLEPAGAPSAPTPPELPADPGSRASAPASPTAPPEPDAPDAPPVAPESPPASPPSPEAPPAPELGSACSTRPSNKSGSGAASSSCPALHRPPTIKTANTRQAFTGLRRTIFFPCILR